MLNSYIQLGNSMIPFAKATEEQKKFNARIVTNKKGTIIARISPEQLKELDKNLENRKWRLGR